MGQEEISNLLKRNYPKYLTAKEIAKKLGLNQATVSISLLRLKKRENVEYRLRFLRGWKISYRINGGEDIGKNR